VLEEKGRPYIFGKKKKKESRFLIRGTLNHSRRGGKGGSEGRRPNYHHPKRESLPLKRNHCCSRSLEYAETERSASIWWGKRGGPRKGSARGSEAVTLGREKRPGLLKKKGFIHQGKSD